MVKFKKFYVQRGAEKARVFYSASQNLRDGKLVDCVTVYAKDYDRALGRVFNGVAGAVYSNHTDSVTDYYDEGSVRVFFDSPFYADALAQAKARFQKVAV